MKVRMISVVILLIGPLFAPAVRAEEPGPFVAHVLAAYPQLKMAWFYCRTGNSMLAAEELEGFALAWNAILSKFGDSPPAPFTRENDWKGVLRDVSTGLANAKTQIAKDDLKGARAAIARVRTTLADLRRRNGITIFGDYIDDYGVVVERLVALRSRSRNAGTLSDDAIAAFSAISADLRKAVQTIRDRAPAAVASDAGFAASIEGNFASIAKLQRGIERRHARAIYGSVSSVRADFILLFTRYG